MHYRIEEKAAMRIVGVRISLTEDMNDNQKIVPQFWEQIWHSEQLPIISDLSNQTPDGLLGITSYENPSEIYYYIAAATSKPIPQKMFEYQIPAATWVVFESNGPFKESVQSVFRRFLTEWLPFSGYAYAELPDIEVYPFNECSRNGYTEVWIAIKREKKNEE